MKKLWKIFFIMLAILTFLAYCTVDQTGGTEENPVPTLTSISPNSKVSHMPAFTLTAAGTDFVSGSSIVFNGTVKQTTYLSAAELTCQVDPDDITAAAAAANDSQDLSGTLNTKVSVLVRNPTPGGGDSGSLDFTINENYTFIAAKKISGSTVQPEAAEIAVDNSGNIYAVWCDTSPGNFDVFFFCSTDNGATWSQAVNLSNNTGLSVFPDITVASTANINVVWMDNTSGHYEIYFKRSTDNGTTWSQAVNISDSLGDSYYPDAAVDSSGNINAGWSDNTPGNYEILFRRSTDNGASWSQAATISNSQAVSTNPDCVVDNSGKIFVVWHEPISGYWQILFSGSSDNGATWNQPLKISYLWGNSTDPLIAVDSTGNINVAWYNDNFNNLFLSRSTDSGATWSQAVNISGSLGVCYGYALSADSAGNINFIFSDGTASNTDIFFIRSTDNGAHWTQAVNVSNITGISSSPKMAVDSAGNINIVFKTGIYLYYTGSTR